jgi:hypothetical protein
MIQKKAVTSGTLLSIWRPVEPAVREGMVVVIGDSLGHKP